MVIEIILSIAVGICLIYILWELDSFAVKFVETNNKLESLHRHSSYLAKDLHELSEKLDKLSKKRYKKQEKDVNNVD